MHGAYAVLADDAGFDGGRDPSEDGFRRQHDGDRTAGSGDEVARFAKLAGGLCVDQDECVIFHPFDRRAGLCRSGHPRGGDEQEQNTAQQNHTKHQ